jgi:predicted O-linked N-acetylglucosamine transferase (SPINDLY family)
LLRIAFLDPIEWDYVVDTPRVKPLGGSQSALCYLAEELAKRGHAVALYNQTKTPGESRGVKCLNLTEAPLAGYSQYDAVIILNAGTSQIARQIRSAVGARTRILLWTQHNPDQPAVKDLADPASHDAWDGLVMVSGWQAEYYRQAFGVHPARMKIIGNAIAPVFENLFATPEAIVAQKPWSPVLCYTSTPFRGLDVLVEAFPRIRKNLPGTTLKVYSSMSIYSVPESQDSYADLYARCRDTEGVDYIGSVSQTVLAGELKRATCLAYPNTFAEGYCIAVHEAMAAGCIVITSDLGALRETTAGFAHLLAPPSDKTQHAELYADFAVGVLERARSSPAEHAERLQNQVRFVHQTETWAVRAREWEEWLSAIVVRAESGATAPHDLFAVALQHHHAGRLQEAEALYRQILQARPDHPDALHNLGMIAYQVGRYDVAVDCISLAIKGDPSRAAFHNNLGEAYCRWGRLDEALASYQRALALSPGLLPIISNIGGVLRQQGRLEEAAAHYRRMLQLHPESADLCNNLGNVLQEQGNFEEALVQYRQAVTLKPDCSAVYSNMGGVFYTQGKLEEAQACFQQALALNPDFAEAHNNLGNVLRAQDKLEEALAHQRQALRLRPNYVEAECQALHLTQQLCEWDQLTEGFTRLRSLLSAGTSAPIHPFAFLSVPGSSAEQLRCARNHAARCLAPVARLRDGLGFQFTKADKPKLRVGYLSADFQQHATAYLITELFELHDRTQFEIVAYSYGANDGGPMRARIADACDRFVELTEATFIEAARRIHEDGIDILIDLKGYTRAARPEILALRPAPIQVSWLGYPGTMGAEWMDYIITDRFITPPGHEPFFSEKLVYLPDCYQINDRKREIAKRTPTRKECGLPEKGVVFCSFNNTYKITPAVFDIWMRVLREIPGSVLWLLEANTGAAANLRREAKARGVEPERLVFAPIVPLDRHLARHRNADLFLDTWPYNAHTTASDALWAGLPVLTCAGETFASRVAGSLLTAVGLPELITSSPAAYEALAVRLARTPSELADLRERLAKNRLTAPLFDSERFTRHIERAYRMMWEMYVRGEAPRPIEVPGV